jgi:hypothetical protein
VGILPSVNSFTSICVKSLSYSAICEGPDIYISCSPSNILLLREGVENILDGGGGIEGNIVKFGPIGL